MCSIHACDGEVGQKVMCKKEMLDETLASAKMEKLLRVNIQFEEIAYTLLPNREGNRFQMPIIRVV